MKKDATFLGDFAKLYNEFDAIQNPKDTQIYKSKHAKKDSVEIELHNGHDDHDDTIDPFEKYSDYDDPYITDQKKTDNAN